MHTKYSGLARVGFLRFPESTSEPRAVVKKANAVGLSVVCVTDHNSITGGVKAKAFEKEFPGTEVIVGEEISTRDGEVIGLFLTEEIPRDLSAEESIERIRDQGGLAFAPHPFSRHVPALGLRVDHLDLDGLEVFNSGHVDGYANTKALEYSRSGKWAQVGGSDSHAIDTIGCAYTEFEGQTAEEFRREFLAKRTTANGVRMPLDKVIKWMVGVVFRSDVLILRSMLGLDGEEDPDDAVVNKVKEIGTSKKMLALAGSVVFFTPPVPYLVELIGERVVKKRNSVPIHEPEADHGFL